MPHGKSPVGAKSVQNEVFSSSSNAGPWRENAEDLLISELLSYRLYKAANSMQKSASLIYKKQFDISLTEWRALGLVFAYAPLSQIDLGRLAGFDKGQVSRVVSGLDERGFISREAHPDGGRLVNLTLTKKGQKLYSQIIGIAQERNRAFIAALSDEEKVALDSALRKITLLGAALARR